MLRHSILLIALSLLCFACNTKQEDATTQAIKKVEKAHGLEKWWKTKALQFDIQVTFGEEVKVDGQFTFETNAGRVHAKLKNDTVAIFDGKKAWVSSLEKFPRARFHLLTWPWFISTPMKLRGGGASLSEVHERELQSKKYLVSKQTFAKGTGDTPDDWYLIYIDPQTNLVYGSAYIVTYGKDIEKAEETPKIVTFHDYVDLDGTKISTKWLFHKWNEKEGIIGSPVGKVVVSNLKFVDVSDEFFAKPEQAIEDKLPGVE